MRKISSQQMLDFERYLVQEERSSGTIEKYLRDVRKFAAWLGETEVTKEAASAWKKELAAQGYKPVTINSMIAALNSFFRFTGWEDCRVRFLRIQRQSFRQEGRQLSRGDYEKLLAAAERNGKVRLHLLMEAICSTGIRVSEVRYLTVEAAKEGRAEITMKGKIRVILLPGKLCRKLLKYAKKQKITGGELFLTPGGKPLSRKQIWAEMKGLCKEAGVEPSRVFPHNLRHLFARTFYRICRDLAKLADVLGHSSIDTTRIYLTTTETEQAQILDKLQLVS